MKIGAAEGRPLMEYGSSGVTVTLLHETSTVRVTVATFEPEGTIGVHPTGVPQRFAVIDGTGWVSGPSGERSPVGRGQVVTWEVGEDHASGSDDGMTVVIIQSLG